MKTPQQKAAAVVRSQRYTKKFPEKIAAQSRKYYDIHADSILESKRRYKGFPAPARPTSAVCECCGKPPGKRKLHLDHDHTNGRFRGWLCVRCNTGIGLLGDSRDGILNAFRYFNRVELL
jgi:hypothetical protein